ncbi:hypothetical protein [Ferrimonas balearica]|uniref:hypothetical protein n=1 Tax=Ferrimonas balearica TaxID=44012 RepID=UPI001F41CEC4|nr:hypothetical protein [Ferrimonas balearica]MBY6094901.1 hypothetical protein [Ferrimonas balearica]
MRQTRLNEAYRGEIYGIAFFQHMLSQRPEHATLWQTLFEVEVRTAALLSADQAVSVSAPERASLWHKGVAQASQWDALPWPELLTTLIGWVTPYEQRYREWAEADPQLALVARHETAIWQALKDLSQGGDGLTPLHQFLGDYSL